MFKKRVRYFSIFADETVNLRVKATFGNSDIWSTKKEKEKIIKKALIKKA